ncbi:Protein of unknown function [Pseudomonas flavescens]|uniref:DUF3168 domain-containing protein n=1 Tax=Phytopseudomonas flavescens TaxID=29435 RepID=A0A1G8NC08_9GAMM|nr:DUF3168 domain-containing protein [Pseudomonas flavescens]SDI77626.1 Protein of unknown function [Pseudomonas flavescens]
MYPPIFETAIASDAVLATLGSSPTRLYTFGDVPEGVIHPYAVWQTIGGAPKNYLDGRPDIDLFTLRVRVYGDTIDSIRQVAAALRDAIEPQAHITRWRSERKDTETGYYCLSFDLDWQVDR